MQVLQQAGGRVRGKGEAAEQRYQKLIATNPDIIQHVPLQYIASFLRIKPESLSRIRRQIML